MPLSRLRIFGLFWGVFRTFSVPICAEAGQPISPKRHDLSHLSGKRAVQEIALPPRGYLKELLLL